MALPAHRADELAYFVKHADAVAYFAPDRLRDFDYRPMAAEIARRSPSLRLTFIAGEPWPGQVSLADMARPGGVAEGEIDALAPPADDVALMLLSGGTTGVPKLIPRTHNDYVYNCRQCGRIAGFGPDTVFLAVLPMSHNYTLGCPGVLGALAAGGTAVIAPDASAETVFPLIARERVTVISASDAAGGELARRRRAGTARSEFARSVHERRRQARAGAARARRAALRTASIRKATGPAKGSSA